MPEVYDISWDEVHKRVAQCASRIHKEFPAASVYGVPTGGLFPALALATFTQRVRLVESPECADIYVDDVYDSGKTIAVLQKKYGYKPAYYLVDKREEHKNTWIRFPWERVQSQGGPEDTVTRMLQYIGEDPSREGLKDTPKRVVKSWGELFGGYKEDPEKVLTVFSEGACDEMVVLRDIEFSSCCEHHIVPFMGSAHIAYVPNKRVIGVSKLVRLLEIYSKRLQIQERLCQQVTGALDKHLQPLGSACILSAQHLCVSGDTRVQLAFLDRTQHPDGVPIRELVGKEGLKVFCYDKLKGLIVVAPVAGVWKSGVKKVYKVTYEWFSNNQWKKVRKTGDITVTEDHQFMLRKVPSNHYNNPTRRYHNGDYLSIKDGLRVGDSLMPFTCIGDKYRVLHLNNGGTVQEHRFLLQSKLGRRLTSKEIAHHDNENPLDNSYDNLKLVDSISMHNRLHPDSIKKASSTRIGKPAHNRKPRAVLICQVCGEGFTCPYASLEKVRKFCSSACTYESRRLKNHRVVSIEEVGVQDVYDLEVPEYNNFAANEVIVHNCMVCRGVKKQNSVMITSSLTGIFKEDGRARQELFSLLKG